MARRVNGESVRALRQALGISQASLALRCGVTPSQLNKVEHGVNGVSDTVLRKVADELGVPLAAITYPVPDEVPDEVPA